MVFLQRRLAAIGLIATELATQYDALILLRARVKGAEAAQSARRRRKSLRHISQLWRAVRSRHGPAR
jgi:hypothetical protein